MSIPKFLSMLSRRALYFSTLEALGDDYEGRYSDATLARFPNLRDLERHSRSLAINCWSLAPADSPVHWSAFCPGGFGVAVVSSLARLRRAFYHHRPSSPSTLFAARVHYIDFSKYLHAEPDSPLNLLTPVTTKRLQFQAGTEVRLILIAAGDPKIKSELDANHGANVGLNLATAVAAVVCGPGTPPWFQADIESLLKLYRFSSVPISRSTADAKRKPDS